MRVEIERDTTSRRAAAVKNAPRPRVTTAGRLLAELSRSGADLAPIARGLGCDFAHLDACRAGEVQLSHEQQMRLAALALLVAPEHGRRARALYAQAQTAIRLEVGEIVSHTTYPKEHFR